MMNAGTSRQYVPSESFADAAGGLPRKVECSSFMVRGSLKNLDETHTTNYEL
jgi:hypothetical protein